MSGHEQRTTKHRRADYEQTLSTIRANVGDPQRALIEAGALWTTLVANGRLEHEHASSALRAAVENGATRKGTFDMALMTAVLKP